MPRASQKKAPTAAPVDKERRPPDQRAPLCLYVGWHAASEQAAAIASEIYKWFRGDPFDLKACGSGVPVQYRAWRPDAGPYAAPYDLPEIAPRKDRSSRAFRVFVPLIDEHFAACRGWRAYLYREIARAEAEQRRADAGKAAPSVTVVLPVALHPGAYQLRRQAVRLNFLRPHADREPAGETPEQRGRRVAPAVLNQLTDALGRRLLADQRGFDVAASGPPPKISMFVSHAKADGVDVAGLLRDEIRRRGQLEAFYDENDLAFGHGWKEGLERALDGGSAMLLAVLTDAYASRPWCRRELRSMRVVRERRAAGRGARARVCKLAPVLVVDALKDRATEQLPDVGPAPVFRHRSEAAGLVVDAAVRLVLQYAYDFERAKGVAAALPAAERARSWVVNAPPDLRTIAEVARFAERDGVAAPALLFPGPGVTDDSLADWRRLFPALSFRRFEDVRIERDSAPARESSARGSRTVALSIGESRSQSYLGFGAEHRAEVLVRVARLLLRNGRDLAYGGDLRTPGFARLLIEVVRAEDAAADERALAEEDGDAPRPGRMRRLANYLAWPRTEALTVDARARYLSVCRFVPVAPVGAKAPAGPFDPATPEAQFLAATSLSAMRRSMSRGGAPDTDDRPAPAATARVVLGGKVADYAGFLPGVAEEAAWTLDPGEPARPAPRARRVRPGALFVLGGFGGAARLLAKGFLSRRAPEFLTTLESAALRRAERLRAAVAAAPTPDVAAALAELDPERRFATLRRAFRGGLRTLADSNGLTRRENAALLETTDVGEILRILNRAPTLRSDAGPPPA